MIIRSQAKLLSVPCKVNAIPKSVAPSTEQGAHFLFQGGETDYDADDHGGTVHSSPPGNLTLPDDKENSTVAVSIVSLFRIYFLEPRDSEKPTSGNSRWVARSKVK
jgi:hypothetical protein